MIVIRGLYMEECLIGVFDALCEGKDVLVKINYENCEAYDLFMIEEGPLDGKFVKKEVNNNGI